MRRWPALWLIFILALGGCRALPPPAPPPTPVTSVGEILGHLAARQERLKAFQAKGRLTVISPQRNYSGSSILKAQAPGGLRVDVLDVLGRSILSFSSDGDQIQVLSHQEAKFFRGKATPENVAVFLPARVTVPQVVRLLTASLPLSSGPPQEWHYEPTDGAYLLTWGEAGGASRERLWVEPRGFRPVKVEWYEQGRRRFSVEFSEFGEGDTGTVPRKIVLRGDDPQAELRVAYRDLQLNPSLTSADLVVNRPPGAAEVLLRP